MITKQTTIKLSQEEFNEMPGREVIEEILKEMDGVTIVDTDKLYWQNTEDTLVIEIDGSELFRFGGKTISDNMEKLTQLIHRTRPDELNSQTKGNKKILRLWWD